MNLNLLRENLIKIRPLLLLVLAGAVAYLAYYLISSIVNPNFGVLAQPTFKSQVISKPVWVTEALSIPGDQKAPVYKVTKRGFSVKEAGALAKKLQFRQTPKFLQGSVLNWTDKGQQLNINLDSGDFNYRVTDKSVFLSGTAAVDIDFISVKGNEYLDSLGVDKSNVDLKKPKVEYYKSSPQTVELGIGTEKDANVVILIYPKKIAGLNLVDSIGEQTIKVTVTTSGKLIAIHFVRIEFEEGDATYPLEKQSVLAEKIAKKGAFVVRYKDVDSAPINDPKKVFVSKGNLRLYDDFTGKYIQPIFVFDGLVYKNFKSSQVEIYYPAVASKYLK